MKEQLVGFEVAKLAKEKQFYDENVYGEVRLSQPNYYDNSGVLHDIREAFDPKDYDLKDCCNTPTQSLLQKWLREVHNIHLELKKNVDGYSCLVYPNYELDGEFWVNYIMEMTDPETRKKHIHKTYEEALEVGLLEGLKLIEWKNN